MPKKYINADALIARICDHADNVKTDVEFSDKIYRLAHKHIIEIIEDEFPAADVIEVPKTGISDLSDGYHTFNGLYEQRMILFAALVKAYKDKAWKSYKHEDGELCFGGGWFIVGIDTPKGSYTYHYENKYWDNFDCVELPVAKHWDGHTEEDAEDRLMSLHIEEVKHGEWIEDGCMYRCSECGNMESYYTDSYCRCCGAKMDGKENRDEDR